MQGTEGQQPKLTCMLPYGNLIEADTSRRLRWLLTMCPQLPFLSLQRCQLFCIHMLGSRLALILCSLQFLHSIASALNF